MILDIEFKGTTAEQKYMKQIIRPYGENNTSDVNNFALDSIVLGEEVLRQAKEKTFYNDNVKAVMKPLKLENDALAIYENNDLKKVDEEYINRLIDEKRTDSRLIFLLEPKEKNLSFHNTIPRTNVFEQNDQEILFSYSINDDSIKQPCVVKMSYSPSK